MAEPFSRISYLRTAASLAFNALREGRLPLSPRRWLLDLRHLRAHMPGLAGAEAAPAPEESATIAKALVDQCRTELTRFLRAGDELRFPEHDRPTVSVLLVLYNRAELTLHCLQALRKRVSGPFELVIVDNHSTDETSTLLDRLRGVQTIRQGENLGFLRACNIAARAARGRYLLFLNNDTEVQAGSVAAALETLERDDSIGCVGGCLVFPDGRLQEAGSIIWNDGSCLGYGRGDSPDAPQYSYRRDVDFCSGAFLLTPRTLFLERGGFDERYQPAYYEDADYCVRVWKAGRRVVYEPRAVVMHFEFASSASAAAAVAMQVERQISFADTHREWLAGQVPPTADGILRARDRRRAGQRILVVDDRVPHTSNGFGDPRAVALLTAMVALGHSVTLLPISPADEDWERIYEDIPREIEVLRGYGSRRVGDVFRERTGYYDRIVVSRSHNMALLRAKLGEPARWMPGAGIVYDAEAITATRDVRRRRLLGEPVSDVEMQRLVATELDLARGVDRVFTVSQEEQRTFETLASGHVHVVGHATAVTPTARSFQERAGVLFVGAFHELSPNADAAVWFARNVWPALRRDLGAAVSFTIAGQNPPAALLDLRAEGVTVLDGARDLVPLYDAARVFVAPTRFASGIPLKVIHAAAHGVPVVATSLLAQQLEWRDRWELLVADSAEDFVAGVAALYRDPVLWDRMRAGALARVTMDYSVSAFTGALNRALMT